MKTIVYKNIVCDDSICGGKPIIDGTRITVNTILGFLLAGETDEDILKNYPRLTASDIETIREYSTQKFEPHFFIHPLAS
ncbi:MAG: DUF433 domain-containing protein [Chitinophagaceae bacterium]|nr:DUF433 domain-containing protein [Chitinophagaceae bacterium]